MPDFPFAELLRELTPTFPHDGRWAVACGSALALHGLDDHAADLDFYAGREDACRIGDALSGRADVSVEFPIQWRSSATFASHWGRFRTGGGVGIDVVGDMSVKRDGSVYAWRADHPCWSRLARTQSGGVEVPVFSLEDLLVLYLALADEGAKVRKLCRRLEEGGCDRAYLRQMPGRDLIERAGIAGLFGE